MDLTIPEVTTRRRIVLEGYLDFSNSVTSWDIYKNMLRKSSEMFVYCHSKKALICPTPRRRGVKEDGCIIAYNSGYILSIGENEETCTEYISWLRKKFRQHDPSVPLEIKQVNSILRVEMPSKIGLINIFKLYNTIIASNHVFEILFDPELYTAMIISFQPNGIYSNEDTTSANKFLRFPDEQVEEAKNEITQCCFVVSVNYILVHKVKDHAQGLEAVQMLMKYLYRNDLIVAPIDTNVPYSRDIIN
ncbi:hypothetical protein [Cryptosporidium parvum Iowa II]|uniref:Uncharacterized protein n=2 Tax=Cryptosporidium parvum TaxID=5807 RepID=Q5CXV7_CRYPI|nr:hypothetical protein [Cryptosporidium parvum Iowa II]EAK90444.1 hypothetical protein cgd7_4750 [Cryptosporidium parvum Iowa II]QOY40801.1 Uncharacterized protein CPATCC_0010650 [Cryptosporidium parvum]WKS79168.1 hypothetical protein CPCDC_7g4750 [Cryptosporidium sp. 43IA8]WRK33657.1 Uncharacterized protein cpbgf_7004750 [Cryptosporidium parvum]|eukprot:QOY40801.1 hypothetical protein CPATCC_003692 [Cryptosporidium parvum]